MIRISAKDDRRAQLIKTSISEFLRKDDSKLQKLFESPAFNKELKEFVIKVKEIADETTSKEDNSTADSKTQETLNKFSEDYKTFFLNFFEGYKKWKLCRKRLIRKSTAYADKISLFSRVVSTVRLITSIVNILGTLELFPQFPSFWSHPTVIHSPAIALGFIQGGSIVSRHYQKKAKKFIKRDEDVYKELNKWFSKAKKLDGAVNILFPKGIDKELVRKFDRQSITQDEETAVDESTKLLASIFASNAKDNISLLEDKGFVDKAIKFATSDAGIQWFHKTILETDPIAIEICKLRLSENMTDSDEKLFSDDKAKVSLCTLLPVPTLKIVLNVVTIFSAFLDLWESDCGDSHLLRKLAVKANEDFEDTKRVLKFLCPKDIDISNELD